MNPISKEIKLHGTEIGFSVIRFAAAKYLDEEKYRLEDWLSKKYHGVMEWMEKTALKRLDPISIMPDAKSIIVCAINYYNKIQRNENNLGKISRYASGDDYHNVIKVKLNELLKFIIEKVPNSKNKIYVDSGPVMEKVWAKRSGIGWQGKHSIILNEKYGSWMFLGVIITDIELSYDSPVEDMCGDCTLCIDACPTGAIVQPYILDASKCISYFTVEYRGKVDAHLSSKFNNWILGCDICQDVCPWNKKSVTETEVIEFQPKDYSRGIEFEKILSMEEKEFSNLFDNSPIKRRTLEGLRENVRRIYNINKIS